MAAKRKHRQKKQHSRRKSTQKLQENPPQTVGLSVQSPPSYPSGSLTGTELELQIVWFLRRELGGVSVLHWLVTLGYGVLLGMTTVAVVPSLGGLILFLVVCCIPMLLKQWRWLLLLVAVALLCLWIPILAPIATVLCIVLFFKRLLMVLRHWRLVLVGFFLYFSVFALAVVFSEVFKDLGGKSLTEQGITVFFQFGPISIPWFVIVAPVGALGMHLAMRWVTKRGMDPIVAVGIMGLFPLILLGLLLPFLEFGASVEPTIEPVFEPLVAGETVVSSGEASLLAGKVAQKAGTDSAVVASASVHEQDTIVESTPDMAEAIKETANEGLDTLLSQMEKVKGVGTEKEEEEGS